MPRATKLTADGKPKLSEADVTRQVKDYLEFRGWRAVRMNVGTWKVDGGRVVKFGEKSMPDWLFIFYLNSVLLPTYATDDKRALVRHIWIEFKAPGKRPTKAQRAWHKAEAARGALVLTVDNYEEFKDWYERTF